MAQAQQVTQEYIQTLHTRIDKWHTQDAHWNENLLHFLASDYFKSDTRECQSQLFHQLVSQEEDTAFSWLLEDLEQFVQQQHQKHGTWIYNYPLKEQMIRWSDLDYAISEISEMMLTDWGREHKLRWQAETGQITQEELTMSLLKL